MRGLYLGVFFTLKTPKTIDLGSRKIFCFRFWGDLLAFWWPWIGLTRSLEVFLGFLGQK
jgi:hypothetical protein